MRNLKDDAWLIGFSYIAMAIPCIVAYLILRHLFTQHWIPALMIPVATYVSLAAAGTIGYRNYYGTYSKTLRSDEAVKLILHLASFALVFGMPALLFSLLAIYVIFQKSNYFQGILSLLVANLFAVLYVLRIRKIRKKL